ncbi:HNH endonuclease [Nonomuraea aridisoli]|uniref:HNH endonuclease n=1 Tax=Nonomuraea aridisoli TaxID=2070368 RepID=A0A2W2E916_9ACTN|nr:HNH endonuclease [Nonomuraea aridisoli]PZG20612.1 HNH endonuclease [Nonomuraea aridisoli]
MPGWKGSTRRHTLPPNWPDIRRAVLRRDGYQCTHIRADTGNRCGERATDVDHLGDRDDHRLQNLAAKCAGHHRRKSSRQGAEAANARRIPRNRPPDPHPGLTA